MVLWHIAGKHPEAWFTLDDDLLDNCSGDVIAFMNEAICVTATRLPRRTATSCALYHAPIARMHVI